jgi:hypothetical protein
MSDSLTAEYLVLAERDARRFSGAYTGTSGTLAAHTLRAIQELRRMSTTIETLEQQNEALRQAVTVRLSGAEQPDTIPADWILRGQRELEEERRPVAAPLPKPKAGDPPAVKLLLDAAEAVRQRRDTYGPPADHFSITVALINAAFGTSFRPEDWATIMQLDKIARSRGPGSTADNDIDLAGYAACRHEVTSSP